MSAETGELGKFVERFTRDLAYKAPEQWPGLLEAFLDELVGRFDKPADGTEWGAKWSDGGYCPATPRRSEEFARKHATNFGTRPIRREVGPWVYADTGEVVDFDADGEES